MTGRSEPELARFCGSARRGVFRRRQPLPGQCRIPLALLDAEPLAALQLARHRDAADAAEGIDYQRPRQGVPPDDFPAVVNRLGARVGG